MPQLLLINVVEIVGWVLFGSVVNNDVRRTQLDVFDGRVIGTALRNPDFMTLARAFDVAGVRASSPAELETALAAALAGVEPTLIEVPIGGVPSPWHLLS